MYETLFTIAGIVAVLAGVGYGLWYILHRNQKPRSGGSPDPNPSKRMK